jgi:DNA-binding transcriptional regulator YiaG
VRNTSAVTFYPKPYLQYHLYPHRASREFVVDALHVKEIRKKTGLTQEKFCHLIDVNIGTLRNWSDLRTLTQG